MIRVIDYTLDLRHPFGIARGTRSQAHVAIVNVDGGWGEASPSLYYQESVETVHAALEKVQSMRLPDLDYIEDAELSIGAILDGLPGSGPTGVPELRNQSAKAAIDIALWDRLGRKLGAPVYKLLGRAPREELVTSFTIGIADTDEMLRKVDEASPYRILKIKLGRDVSHDVKVMREIRKAVGDKTIRVDANCGWSLEQAKRVLPVMADLGIEFVEQPLEKGALAELAELHKSSPVPIYVDEDSVTARDLPRLQGIVDGINIKLVKSGGITEARRMIALARILGFRIMLGCMLETSVLITAAAHLAPFADALDLDGNILVSNDPFQGAACDAAGVITLSDEPGLGVSPRPECADIFADIPRR